MPHHPFRLYLGLCSSHGSGLLSRWMARGVGVVFSRFPRAIRYARAQHLWNGSRATRVIPLGWSPPFLDMTCNLGHIEGFDFVTTRVVCRVETRAPEFRAGANFAPLAPGSPRSRPRRSRLLARRVQSGYLGPLLGCQGAQAEMDGHSWNGRHRGKALEIPDDEIQVGGKLSRR